MKLPETFEELFEKAKQEGIYKKLIQQLNKDFILSNIQLQFHEEILDRSLLLVLRETVYELFEKKNSEYLNLLYIVDVPEIKIKKLDSNDIVTFSKTVTFLILQREFQKIWYKHKHS